jgi:hypothetical protein
MVCMKAKFDLGIRASSRSSFYRVKLAQPFELAIEHDVSDPGSSPAVPANTCITTAVVFVPTGITTVFLAGYRSKVCNSIVATIPIDVVDLVSPNTINIHPRNLVGSYTFAFNAKFPIAFGGVNPAGDPAGVSRIPLRTFFGTVIPTEFSSLRIVRKDRPNAFGRRAYGDCAHHIAPPISTARHAMIRTQCVMVRRLIIAPGLLG